jgi:hypothetical protein
LFDNPAVMPTAAPKKQRSLLPLLVVVFLGSYGLMTMLIVEQGAAIQQQHNLIQVLQQDSRDLWAIRGRAVADKNARDRAQKHAQSPATAPPAQSPSTQVPQQRAPNHAAKPKVQLPPVPAADLGDQRRVLITL